jgi:chemotaxis response regulator CheB
MLILHGVLSLIAPTVPSGLRLPIDFFFHSLAEDCKEHSIGVILYGMGSDGTVGWAFKEKAVLVLVKKPTALELQGMSVASDDQWKGLKAGIERIWHDAQKILSDAIEKTQ